MKSIILLSTLLNPLTVATPSVNAIFEISTTSKNETYEDLTYLSLLPPVDEYSYYGRILKYYYANNIKVSTSDLEFLQNQLTITAGEGVETSYFENLYIQNILASTLVPSIEASKSDSLFFAESYSKWLTTEDSIKNKSWEITNNFFMYIMPELLKFGGPFSGNYDSTTTFSSKVQELVNTQIGKVVYDTTKTSTTGSTVNLQYADRTIIWNNNATFHALINIAMQVLSEGNNAGTPINVTHSTTKSLEILKNWMVDSSTAASASSISKFNDFIGNYFSTFTNLDSKLKLSSLDKNSYSLIRLSNIFDDYDFVYSNATPVVGYDYESWIFEHKLALQEITLKIYNSFYSLINDENLALKVLTSLVFSPDFPLVGYTEFTKAYSEIEIEEKDGVFVSANRFYTVISGPSLTIKDYSNLYKTAFWSSPTKFAVLVQEMGKALDAYGSRTSENREADLASTVSYSEVYSGEIFMAEDVVYKTPMSLSTILAIVFGIIGGIILTTMISLLIVMKLRYKKNSSNEEE